MRVFHTRKPNPTLPSKRCLCKNLLDQKSSHPFSPKTLCILRHSLAKPVFLNLFSRKLREQALTFQPKTTLLDKATLKIYWEDSDSKTFLCFEKAFSSWKFSFSEHLQETYSAFSRNLCIFANILDSRIQPQTMLHITKNDCVSFFSQSTLSTRSRRYRSPNIRA